MQVLELPPEGTPYRWGVLHGATFRSDIHAIADIRVRLAKEIGQFRDTDQVLQVAQAHMPVLKAFDRALYSEIKGIAEGSGLSEAEIVVVNHYTDLRDIGRSVDDIDGWLDAHPAEGGGCSAIYAQTPQGPLLGQTWDIHGSAMPFVAMLKVPEHTTDHGVVPACWVLTITGCVGMAGINTDGVAVTINNLRSLDAKVGVLWPALVRRMLGERTADGAQRLLMEAPVGSGHHYLVADSKNVFGVETSGQLKRRIFDEPQGAFIHTNHCLDEAIAERSDVAPTSTTFARYERLTQDLNAAPIAGLDDLWTRFASVYTNLQTPTNPHGVRTCATAVMALDTRRMWVVEDKVEPEHADLFTFD
ncbi:MAG: C45 family peptidase [Myxococcota bacterium]